MLILRWSLQQTWLVSIFSEDEAKQQGLKVNKNINYHGLGENLFLDVIDGLDDVTEAYRGTKVADNSSRRENYFLLISKFSDADGNIINVPVYIEETALSNKVFFDTNKISTVYGKERLKEYIQRQIRDKNLVRIKNRSNISSESNAPIAEDYRNTAPKDSISNDSENVKQKQLEIIQKTNPAPNEYSTWVRTVEDIKTLAETLEDDDIAPVRKDIEPARVTAESSNKITPQLDDIAPVRNMSNTQSGQNKNTAQSGAGYSVEYESTDVNDEILKKLKKIETKQHKANEKVYFDDVSSETAQQIEKIVGVNPTGFKMAVEARQLEHTVVDHGKEGTTDRSMSDDNDIAKMEYTLYNYDSIIYGGKTKAYSVMRNGYNRTADTVLYEKKIGDKSYYVV